MSFHGSKKSALINLEYFYRKPVVLIFWLWKIMSCLWQGSGVGAGLVSGTIKTPILVWCKYFMTRARFGIFWNYWIITILSLSAMPGFEFYKSQVEFNQRKVCFSFHWCISWPNKEFYENCWIDFFIIFLKSMTIF